jgi:tetratricopeptide (TPR) repeat protein
MRAFVLLLKVRSCGFSYPGAEADRERFPRRRATSARAAPVRPLLCAVLLVLLAACAPGSPEAEGARLAQRVIHRIESKGPNMASLRVAATELLRARELAPDDPWVALAAAELSIAAGYLGGDNFGRSSYHPQALKAAEDEVRRALEIAPGIARSHRSLARIQQLRGRLQEAWMTLNEAYRLEPEHPQAWLLRSVISLQMNDRARALAMLEEAELRAREVHEVREVLAQRARIARIGGDHEKQLALLQQLIDLEPDNAYAHANLAQALMSRGRDDDALPHLRRAVELGRGELDESQLRAGGIRPAQAAIRRPGAGNVASDKAASKATVLQPYQ